MDDATQNMGRSDIYLNHLYLATYARNWAARIQQDVYRDPASDAEYMSGYSRAILDIADHLSEGDCLPGGPVYRIINEEVAFEKRVVERLTGC